MKSVKGRLNKIICPNCLGKGLVTDPVLESSVVDAPCPVCEGTGKTEARYEILSRFCKPKYKNDVLVGWQCSVTTFVPASDVEPSKLPIPKRQSLRSKRTRPSIATR